MPKISKNSADCNSLCNYKSAYENGNCGSYKTLNSIMCNINQDVKSEPFNVDGVNTSFKNLKITPFVEGSEKTGDTMQLAGTIINTIPWMNTVLIKPLSSTDLLYLGTPLYLDNKAAQTCTCKNLHPLGYIDDIFGSIKDPMYCMELCPGSGNLLKAGEQIYYSQNNPDTKFMYVEHTKEHNTVKHRIKTRKM